MAPKSALLTAGTTSPPPKPNFPGRIPATTQEKLDAAAAKKAKAPAKTMSPPPESTGKKKKKISKYLPPPGEIFQPPRPKAKARSRRDNRPYTTNEKISADELKKSVMKGLEKGKRAEVRKAKKADDGAKRKEGKEDGGEKGGGGKKAKEKAKAKSYVPSTLALLSMSSTPTAVKFEDVKRKSVLMRPTARAIAEKQALAGKAEAPSVLKPGEKRKEKVPFRIMDLPEEIRNRIWKMAVVHHPFCVWPGQRKGREQPDLAMSGREVRTEVLPVYYGCNVFGIDITPAPEKPEVKQPEVKGEDGEDGPISKDDSKDDAAPVSGGNLSTIPKPEIHHKAPKPSSAAALPDSIAEIKPWALALEKGGHLSSIQHWTFSSTPEICVPGSRIPKIDEQKGLVVYLHIWREATSSSEIVPATEISVPAVVAWRANVEVHGEACCVLPGQPMYQKCIVKVTPKWLNGMVSFVLQRAERKGITAEMIDGVAKVLRTRADELVESKCG